MAELAAIPTRTSVTVTDKQTGGNATIPAATPRAAGVMTAEQCQLLEQLRVLMHSGGMQTTNVVALAQQMGPVDMVDLSLPSPLEVLPPNHSDDLARRVAALEALPRGETIHSIINAVTTLRDSIAQRLAKLEARVTRLETNDNVPPAEINQMRQQISEMQTWVGGVKALLDDPTPVMVEDNG